MCRRRSTHTHFTPMTSIGSSVASHNAALSHRPCRLLTRLEEVNVLAYCAGVGHRGGAVQCNPLCAPAGGKRRRVHGPGQRSALRHLLPHPQTHDAYLWRPEPPYLCSYVWHHVLPSFPRCCTPMPRQPYLQDPPLPPLLVPTTFQARVL